MNDVEILRESGLVEESVIKVFRADYEQVHRTAQVGRTLTEVVLSVLNDGKHPNADAKYWQATKEVDIQYEQLILLSFEYRKQMVVLKQLERDLSGEEDALEIETLLVEIDEARYVLVQQERASFHRLRQIAELTDVRHQLVPQLKFGTEDVNAHQMVSLPQRFRNQVATLSGGEGAADRFNMIGLLKTAERVEAEQAKAMKSGDL